MHLNEPKRLTDSTSGEPDGLADAIRSARAERVSDRAIARFSERMERALGGVVIQAQLSASATSGALQPSASGSVRAALTRLGLAGAALALGYSLLAVPSVEPLEVPPKRVDDRAPMQAPIDWQLSPLANPDRSSDVQTPLAPCSELLPGTPLPASACAPPSAAPSVAGRPRAARAPVRAAVAKASSPEAELRLLQQAQAALRDDPALTLKRTDEHLRVYPSGVFSEEREMIAIEALQKLKHRAAAWQRARSFVERFPLSPHARRVRALLDASIAPVP